MTFSNGATTTAQIDRPTFLTDLNISSMNAVKYWQALKECALRSFEPGPKVYSLPSMSMAWPLITYKASYPNVRATLTTSDLELFLAQEDAMFGNLILIRGEGFQALTTGSANARCIYTSEMDHTAHSTSELKLFTALSLIEKVWPAAFFEIKSTVRGYAFVDSSRKFSSTSDPKIFGLLHFDKSFYDQKSSFELATAIVHEVAHHALFVATAIDPLLVKPSTSLYSPFKGENRPAIGVLHAAVALYRMLAWSAHLADSSFYKTDLSASLEVQRIEETLRPKFLSTVEQLRSVEFTCDGDLLFANLAQPAMGHAR